MIFTRCLFCGIVIEDIGEYNPLCDDCKEKYIKIQEIRTCNNCGWKGVEEDICFNCSNYDKWKIRLIRYL